MTAPEPSPIDVLGDAINRWKGTADIDDETMETCLLVDAAEAVFHAVADLRPELVSILAAEQRGVNLAQNLIEPLCALLGVPATSEENTGA